NALFPLMRVNAGLLFHAFDIAPTAVQLLREHADFDSARVSAFVCDIAKEPVPVADDSCDFAIVIFVLSAMTKEQFPRVIGEIVRKLK
ncbi:class I SAM-dependent methyltransferase, partial [Pseudomonas aeruginosa]|uniref:class I SAM-dependent methyltransferase n=1 Tax=Pseudomonas aeruginosa TaxID=287 RepID=UPI0039C263D6